MSLDLAARSPTAARPTRGTGAVLLWRQRMAVVCAPGGVCSHPAIRNLTLVSLLAGLVLLYLGYAYA